MRTTKTRWRNAACAAAVLLALALPTAPAHAAFTDTETASQKVGAGTVPAPTAATVIMTCQEILYYFVRPKVTVASYTAPSSRANYYDIKLWDPSGDLQPPGDISKATPSQPYTYTAGWQSRGTWKYEIRANYKVPGSTNTWSSAPLTGTLTCP